MTATPADDATSFEIAFLDDAGSPAHIEPIVGTQPAKRRWDAVAKNVRSGGYIPEIRRAEFRQNGAVLKVAIPA